ncbi:MAG: tetraacyldisaccharide 4'-kinase [Deltaproteobacteria bacterium]|nr:MAG: tetraacyldisaccharide 4'-kinase [Deltaproteobacteria bacterium]
MPRWLDERDESFARQLALAPLDVASWLYAGAAWAHRAAAERGVTPPRRLAARVVSVGNLVVGGTAKTPLAAWLAVQLRRRGHKVALASRGYGRSGGEPVEVVSDGRFVLGTADSAGDEPLLLAAQAPGVPVLVGRDRGLAGLRAISAFGADLLVLDDGFQHHRLARDVDVVTFDGGLGLGNRRVLPRGPLREPLGALARADAIGVVDGPLPERDGRVIAWRAPRAYRFAARRAPSALRPLAGGAAQLPAELAGERVGLLAGIARPDAVRRTLAQLGAQVVAERLFRDHHRFAAGDLAGLAEEAPRWITTEKDAVKLVPAWAGRARIDVLAIELAVDAPDALLDWLETKLR